VIIRPETAADEDTIRKINDEAFGDPLEANLVDAIRESDRFLPELSLVAVSEGQTRGHVISSYVDVEPGARRVLQVGAAGGSPLAPGSRNRQRADGGDDPDRRRPR
jgi:putative acetyltransferase